MDMEYKDFLTKDLRFLDKTKISTASPQDITRAMVYSKLALGSGLGMKPAELNAEEFVSEVFTSVGTTPYALETSGCAWQLGLGTPIPKQEVAGELVENVARSLLRYQRFLNFCCAFKELATDNRKLSRQRRKLAGYWNRLVTHGAKPSLRNPRYLSHFDLLFALEIAVTNRSISYIYEEAKKLGYSKKVISNKTYGPENIKYIEIKPENEREIVALTTSSLDVIHRSQSSGVGFIVSMYPRDPLLASSTLELEVFTQPPEPPVGRRARPPFLSVSPVGALSHT